ncbi:hypothetical protein [Gloeobacter morelensis]|uniref:Uncharacterized protein n=1 Tax=Gloeobacter morelensis MG652769 TaxID=2781736 RepID=A0ABY3PS12_9CYAN|nr:hypothetical protein [Gloeobacter morelensis]UFP96523.1 hypothetical protein ISF26_10050 [Gloeobacter morelensis MG652769]
MDLLSDKYLRLSKAYIQLDERRTALVDEHTELKRKFLHLLGQFQQAQQALSSLQDEHAALRHEYAALSEFKKLMEPANVQALEEALQAAQGLAALAVAEADSELSAAEQAIAAYDVNLIDSGAQLDLSTFAAGGASRRLGEDLVFEVPSENAA